MKPLLFSSEQDAVDYLRVMGFQVEAGDISWHGITPFNHRIAHAIDWLCSKFGYRYMGKRDQLTEACKTQP